MILVKALPQPSRKFGETVCCAGVTADRRWKRLYPVRFRYLQGDARFDRWQWVKFEHRPPTSDRRAESCHVYEDRLSADGRLAERDRFDLLAPMIMPSAKAAAAAGHSLALIRPQNTRFKWRRKATAVIEAERQAYRAAGAQRDMLDEMQVQDRDLATFEPSPYQFAFAFTDADGQHTSRCGDWETHAAFYNLRRRYSEEEALRHLNGMYNETYPAKGVAFAIGNMAKRPQIWQLLGVIRLDKTGQLRLI